MRGDRGDVARLTWAAIGITWVPVVLLSLLGRDEGGHPLLHSVSVHVRLLVTIPCFFLAEAAVHAATRRCLERLAEGRWVVDPDGALPRLLASVGRARDGTFAEVALVVVALALSVDALLDLVRPAGAAAPDWSRLPPAALLCYTLVSLPIFHFLGLRWLWRWALWAYLLVRLARLDIRPLATHPDEQGGLSLLSEPSVGFSPVVFGFSAMVFGDRAAGFVPSSEQLVRLLLQGALLALVFVLLAFGPLIVFAPCLFRARLEAERELGNLGAEYVRAFDGRWFGRRVQGGLLGTPDIQSLADLASAWDVLRRMRLVPVTRRQVLVIAVATFLPLVLLVLTKFPLVELLVDAGQVWLGQPGR